MANRLDYDPVIHRASGANRVRQFSKATAIVLALHALISLPITYLAFRADFVSNWNWVLFILVMLLMNVTIYFIADGIARATLRSVVFRSLSAKVLSSSRRYEIRSAEKLKYTLHVFPGLERWWPAQLQVSTVEGKSLFSIGQSNELSHRLREAKIPFEINSWSTPAMAVSALFALLSTESTRLREVSDFFIAFSPLMTVLYFAFGLSRPKIVKRSWVRSKRGFSTVKTQLGIALGSAALSIALFALSITPLSQVDRDFAGIAGEWHSHPSAETLSRLVSFSEQSGHPRHLNAAAWALITGPNPDHRDYVKAEALAKSAALKAKKVLQVGILNTSKTYACALMAVGKREQALKLAEQMRDLDRVKEFSDGKLCEDPRFKVAARSVETPDRRPAGAEAPQ